MQVCEVMFKTWHRHPSACMLSHEAAMRLTCLLCQKLQVKKEKSKQYILGLFFCVFQDNQITQEVLCTPNVSPRGFQKCSNKKDMTAFGCKLVCRFAHTEEIFRSRSPSTLLKECVQDSCRMCSEGSDLNASWVRSAPELSPSD